MAGIGAITLDAAGSVTAPTTGLVPVTLPSADSLEQHRYALQHFAPMPAEKGLMMADGWGPLRHYVTSVLGTGLQAPPSALTATPTGTKADTTFDLNPGGVADIVDGDFMHLVWPILTDGMKGRIIFRTTLSALPLASEVVIGASDGATLENLKKFINQTGVEGVDYYTYTDFSDTITATTVVTAGGSERITFQANAYGTAANAYVSVWYGAAAFRFEDDPGGAGGNQFTFSGGVAGTGSEPSGGIYQYAYAYVREDDGAQSGLSDTVEANNGSGGQVDITGITTASSAFGDTTVDYNRVFRTTNGGGLLYRLDEVLAATTTFTDTTSNDTITNFGALGYDATLYRSYRAGLPTKVRYLANFQGRWFGAGAILAATYQAGTASVTSGVATVTLTGYPRTVMIGRTFQVNSISETYTIITVNEATQVITLDRNYEGTTNGTASYTIKDLRDPYEVYWSEPGLPNNWPVQNSLKGPSSLDGQGCTGLYAAFESVIYFTRKSVWRITGADGIYQAHLVTDRAGCVSGHTVVMDGEKMYWLGEDGVYGWTGSGEPVHLTTPPQQDVAARGQDDTMNRISLAHAHRAVAVADEVRSEIRWYVPLDGERSNRYCIVLDAHAGTFSLDTCEDVTAAWRVEGLDGVDATFTGDIQGCIFQQGLSTSDGAYGFEQVQTVASAGARAANVSGTPFPTSSNGLVGVPVWQVTADGTFNRNCVAQNTSGILTYRRFQTAQATSTQMVVGGILLWVQTGRCDFGDRANGKIVPAYHVSHSPESDGQYFFFYAYEQGDFVVPTVGWTAGDLTVGNTADDFGPRRRFRCRKDAVLHGWGLCCVEPGVEAKFAAVTIEVRGSDDLEV